MDTAAPQPTPTPTISVSTFLAHRRMVVCLFISTVVIVALLAASLQRDNSSALVAIALTGALGGFVSALRRFYSFDPTVDSGPALRIFGRSIGYLLIYSLIPPLIGLVGALVIYVMFAGGLVNGPMFPTFAEIVDNCPGHPPTCLTHFQHFLNDWKPVTNADYAKAFIWGFIAGFSERFVPDMLSKLSAQSDAAK
jgi:nitrate/nitrite transporter NarK